MVPEMMSTTSTDVGAQSIGAELIGAELVGTEVGGTTSVGAGPPVHIVANPDAGTIASVD